MKQFLAETCLLTHGLRGIGDEVLRAAWPERMDCLVWVEDGKIRTGGMDAYLAFRDRGAGLPRIGLMNFERVLSEGGSGSLTASGTMEACRRAGIALAVTCGMGGQDSLRKAEDCPDLIALCSLPVTLLASSPKDLLDIPGTLAYLSRRGVSAVSADSDRCSGFLFRSADVPLPRFDGRIPERGGMLILNGIPEADRLEDPSRIALAEREGREAERGGKAFHPEAAAALERMTAGASAELQLEAFIRNLFLAERISEGGQE